MGGGKYYMAKILLAMYCFSMTDCFKASGIYSEYLDTKYKCNKFMILDSDTLDIYEYSFDDIVGSCDEIYGLRIGEDETGYGNFSNYFSEYGISYNIASEELVAELLEVPNKLHKVPIIYKGNILDGSSRLIKLLSGDNKLLIEVDVLTKSIKVNISYCVIEEPKYHAMFDSEHWIETFVSKDYFNNIFDRLADSVYRFKDKLYIELGKLSSTEDIIVPDGYGTVYLNIKGLTNHTHSIVIPPSVEKILVGGALPEVGNKYYFYKSRITLYLIKRNSTKLLRNLYSNLKGLSLLDSIIYKFKDIDSIKDELECGYNLFIELY